MPGHFTTYTSNKVLDLLLGKQTLTAPTTYYVGLSRWQLDLAGNPMNEPSGGSYARVAVTNNLTNFPAAVNGAKASGTAITFPAPTGDWDTVVCVFLSDAPTGGNIWAKASLNTNRTILNGDAAPKFEIGALSWSFA
jgi:hypothetical protein